MRQTSQSPATAAGDWPSDCRQIIAPARARGRAVAVGASIGLMAGLVWGQVPRRDALKAEQHAVTAPIADVSPGSNAGFAVPTKGKLDRLDEPSVASESGTVGGRWHREGDGESRDASDGRFVCGIGMKLVEGEYCTVLAHRCIEPFSDGSGRCRRYAESARCYPPIHTLRFCIDEYEYPNVVGEKPRVMVDFKEAQLTCASENKRLCRAREWTLACEGPGRLPYPNGHTRDPASCNIDLPHRFPNVAALHDPVASEKELKRLDQRTASGTRPGCVSQYGVHDMVGNVDEWVVPDGPEEAAGFGAGTALKGGYFGPVRSRCRPSTPSHGPTFKFYQVGFRCCRDAAIDTGVTAGR